MINSARITPRSEMWWIKCKLAPCAATFATLWNVLFSCIRNVASHLFETEWEEMYNRNVSLFSFFLWGSLCFVYFKSKFTMHIPYTHTLTIGYYSIIQTILLHCNYRHNNKCIIIVHHIFRIETCKIKLQFKCLIKCSKVKPVMQQYTLIPGLIQC